MISSLEILKKYWGYNKFKSPQAEIIENVLLGNDTIVLLPTGGGKSVCYQVPALLMEGVCVVISPLIALIQDQVNELHQKGIKAIALSSQLSENETIIAFDNLQFGDVKFLYLSPEKLQSKFIQDKIRQLNVSIFAIDEAHCISEWGHDFRPSYLKLSLLKDLNEKAGIIALTATATSKVLIDIEKFLELQDAKLFKTSFFRKNLHYKVIQTQDIFGRLLQLVSKISDSVIIYTNSRKQTKELSSFLVKNGFKSSFYHGGLTHFEKQLAYESWMENRTPIMVATNAFGMGINKPNVRAVIHINTPSSLENYIQEAGRAGRDNLNAQAIILTNETNLFETVAKFKSNTATTKFVKKVYNCLNQFYNVTKGEIPENSFSFNLQEFSMIYKLNILQAYNALKILERENILLLDENYHKKATLKFIVNQQVIFNFINKHPSKEKLIKLILRSYGGVFEHQTVINEYILAKKLAISKEEVVDSLKLLDYQGIVTYNSENSTSKIIFLQPRQDDYTINPISKNIEQQNKLKLDKLNAVLGYIKNTSICRNQLILNYFGESHAKTCKSCDVCLNNETNNTSIEKSISAILALLNKTSYSSKEIVDILNISEPDLLFSLKVLLEKNKIELTSQNKFKLK